MRNSRRRGSISHTLPEHCVRFSSFSGLLLSVLAPLVCSEPVHFSLVRCSSVVKGSVFEWKVVDADRSIQIRSACCMSVVYGFDKQGRLFLIECFISACLVVAHSVFAFMTESHDAIYSCTGGEKSCHRYCRVYLLSESVAGSRTTLITLRTAFRHSN